MCGKTTTSILILLLAYVQGNSSSINSTASTSNNTRIVGGTQVSSRSDFPYQVSLRRVSGNSAFCGASILNDQHILTAAHCVVSNGQVTAPSTLRAVVGDLSTTETLSTTATRVIRHIFVHEEYNSSTIQNDIAVLRIDSLGDFNENVNNLTLASITPEAGTNCVVSGWGTTSYGGSSSSVLLYANVSVVSVSVCQTNYGRSILDGMLCAGNFTHGGTDACQGDSGGPLACNNELVGIVSWGYQCAVQEFPGVYTDVSKYIDWIKEQYGKDSSYILINNFYLILFSISLCILFK